MYHLFYVSCASAQYKGLDDIKSILKSSESYNNKMNISGILLYHSGIFLQLLEGTEADVKKLYNKIFNDPRHSGIQILFESPASDRIFDDWHMAYREVDEFDIKMVNQILSWSRLLKKDSEVSQDKIIKMLHQFKAKIVDEENQNPNQKAV